ncbi:MAG: hypothetical protein U1D67_09385 [Dehalococcoidia bacterium]|nr:hypothetical protein [Dehalococcoidia bacterium]
MNRFREFFSDVFVATGASFLLLSIIGTVLLLIAGLPGNNPYVGAILTFLLFSFFIAGGVVFFLGVIIERKDKTTK